MSQKILFCYWSCPKLKKQSFQEAGVHSTSLLYLWKSMVAFFSDCSHTEDTHGAAEGKPPQCVYISRYMKTGQRKIKISFIPRCTTLLFSILWLWCQHSKVKGLFRSEGVTVWVPAVQLYRAGLIIVLQAPLPLWSVLWLPRCQLSGSAELEASCFWALCHSEGMLWNGQQSLLMGSQHTDLPRLCWALTA